MKWLLLCFAIKNINPSELFIRGRKDFSCFYYRSLFFCTKNMRINSGHNFIMRFPNKKELQQITLNHSSSIEF